ncbi:MAG: methyltransferase [Chromatiales bacterium]|jgi:demethylspheroidene O-methyltransferase
MSAREQASPGIASAALTDGGGLRERWLDFRNRLLASPRFHRWAARFPLTRIVARRRARRLFDIGAGFVYSQILLACVQLGLFERLADGPLSIEDLAEAMQLPFAGAERLLLGAETLQLVERRDGGRYGLGQLGAAVLGNPGIGAMVAHHTSLYADLQDPVALLRGRSDTRLSRFWPYATTATPGALPAQEVDAYSDLMAASQTFVADDVLTSYSLRRFRHLLDLGGGDGRFAATAAQRWPQLQVTVFDLPAVAERAGRRFAREQLSARARAIGGDLLKDPFPEGADIMSLVRVLHDHDDAAVRTILGSAKSALRPGGVLLIAEPMAATRGAEPIGEAYFGFYLLAMGSGRPRTVGQLTALLHEAGFHDAKPVATLHPLMVRLLVARA